MKLISLNIWGGKIHGPLIEFLRKHRNETDIFCFQEIFKSPRNIITHGSYSNIYQELIDLLPEFNYCFSSTGEGYDIKGIVNFPLEFGQMTFVRRNFNKKNEGEVFVYRKRNDIGIPHPDGRPDFPRNFIFTQLEINGKSFLVLNLHGFWEPAPKYDTPERFEQSRIILDFIKNQKDPVILAGDFNLAIDTTALSMIEEKLNNLIRKLGVLTTRSFLYDEKYRKFDKYADYIFVSGDITVKDFKVLEDQVSDHLPLYLEFDV